jgi:hypothetical protein
MNDPRPAASPDVAGAKHEVKDVNVRLIGLLAAGLFISILVACGIVRVLFQWFAVADQGYGPAAPLAAQTNRLPPGPRLQVDPSRDLREMRTIEEQILNSYGWVDKSAGVVRIPVERAMKLMVERDETQSRGGENKK